MSKVVHIAPLEVPLPAATAEERDHLDYSTPEFRAIQTVYGRKGLRLERAFWRALSGIADRLQIKRSQLISDVLGETGTGENATSVLRSYAVHQIGQELHALRERSDLAFLLPILQSAPTASFAVDREKRLVRVNEEFHQFLGDVLAELGSVSRENFVFRLGRAVEEIFLDVGQSGQACECPVHVISGNRLRQFRAKLIAVPPHDPKVVIGYLLNQ